MQNAVNAPCQGEGKPNSSVVAETMKLLANSSYGYQLMNRSHHSITEYTNDEKTRATIRNEMFKRMGYIKDELLEVELAKSEIQHKNHFCRRPYHAVR